MPISFSCAVVYRSVHQDVFSEHIIMLTLSNDTFIVKAGREEGTEVDVDQAKVDAQEIFKVSIT